MLKITLSSYPTKKHNGTRNSTINMNARNQQSPYKKGGNIINETHHGEEEVVFPMPLSLPKTISRFKNIF